MPLKMLKPLETWCGMTTWKLQTYWSTTLHQVIFKPDKVQWGKNINKESLNPLIYNREQSDSKICGGSALNLAHLSKIHDRDRENGLRNFFVFKQWRSNSKTSRILKVKVKVKMDINMLKQCRTVWCILQISALFSCSTCIVCLLNCFNALMIPAVII